jgi:hypothetical protein
VRACIARRLSAYYFPVLRFPGIQEGFLRRTIDQALKAVQPTAAKEGSLSMIKRAIVVDLS